MANVAVIILAAGESKRMGSSKQLLHFQGVTLLDRALTAARGTNSEQVLLVLGAQFEKLAATVTGDNIQIVNNGDWKEGIASSIRIAVENLAEDIDAALFLTCDQPLVDAELLSTIIATYESTKQAVVASDYGTPGVPALFARELLPDLLALSGDKGAKSVILANISCLVSAPQAQYDIDTQKDIERLEELFETTTVIKTVGTAQKR
ncbi:MAG: nucleotidyltransferase family protein [Candidatus Obscuribacterales bacterium]|nr:nucleotidyltransferase family protein [Candidatus Obscuribacterales bacterium]